VTSLGVIALIGGLGLAAAATLLAIRRYSAGRATGGDHHRGLTRRQALFALLALIGTATAAWVSGSRRPSTATVEASRPGVAGATAENAGSAGSREGAAKTTRRRVEVAGSGNSGGISASSELLSLSSGRARLDYAVRGVAPLLVSFYVVAEGPDESDVSRRPALIVERPDRGSIEIERPPGDYVLGVEAVSLRCSCGAAGCTCPAGFRWQGSVTDVS
jgi:hypothetical protein